jgi:hypothetical protein
MEIIKKIIFGLLALFVFIFLFSTIRTMYCQQWFNSFIFSKEINPLDIFNLIISSAVTVWLGWYISKKLTEQRFLKEFIIKDICKIEEQIDFFEVLIRTNNADLSPIFNELNILKHRIERFEKISKLTNFWCNNINDLNNYHTKLFKISTEDMKLSATDEAQKICDNLVIVLRKIVCNINNK